MAFFAEGQFCWRMSGRGETMLARALAASVGCDFKRDSMHADLLPQRHHRQFGF